MKWTNHIDLSKKAMFSYNIRYTSDLINGVIYPDRVGQQGGQVLGVDVGYPHHAKTKSRIKKLLINLRKKKLESGVIDQFSLGVLLHLVQDSESFSFSHPNFEWFQTAMKDIKIDRRVQYEEVPFLGQNITKNEHLSYLSSMNQLCEPPVFLYNGYIKTKMVVRSLCSPNKLPHHLKESYIKNKASLAKKKISRTMYWLFTYLSPLAPLNLFADLGAIKSKTMVERYKRAKDTSFIKGGVSFMMGFFLLLSGLTGQDVINDMMSEFQNPGPVASLFIDFFDWASAFSPTMILLTGLLFLPFVGQLLLSRLKVDKDLAEQVGWFHFE